MMKSLELLFEREIEMLKALVDEQAWAGRGGQQLDPLGLFCSMSFPGSPLRRLVDLGLVTEHRSECGRQFRWQWEITKKGREFLEALAEEED